MREIEYQDFSLKVHRKAEEWGERIPVNATLELTYRCENRCVHCYCNLPVNDKTAITSELTFHEIEELLGRLRDMGTLWLLVTGGDPLVRKDFKDVYLLAKKNGFLVSLFTNGLLIDEEIADFIASYPPFVVEITMYGATEETYEKVTRLKGSYKRYWKGLNLLLERGVKLKLKTMALSINKHEIGEMAKIAKDLGCHFRFDPMLHKRIDKLRTSDPVSYRLSPAEIVKLDKAFPERMADFEEFCDRMTGEPVPTDRLITCGAGRSSLHIMPDGTVLPCSMLLQFGWSVRQYPIEDIWRQKIKRVLDKKREFDIKCSKCKLQNLCGQCPGWSYVEYGDLRREVKYLCEVARARAEGFPFLDISG